MVEKSYGGSEVVEQLWWNRNGETVAVKSTGGTVMAQQKWWNSNGGTKMVEQ